MRIPQISMKVHLDTFWATQKGRANVRSYIIAASRVNTLSSDHILVVEKICTQRKIIAPISAPLDGKYVHNTNTH